MLLRRLLFAAIALFCTENALAETPSPWQFEAGLSAGRPTPFMLNVGVGYENVFFRAMGSGLYFGTDDYWVGYRGSLDWKFFRELPFSLDLGIAVGYSFAEAPNEMHKAMNRANDKRFVRPYNYKEAFDISAEVRTNFYGFFSQLCIPFHYFMKHDEPKIFWQFGYAYKF